MDGLDALLNEAQQERDRKTAPKPKALPKLPPSGRAEPTPRPAATVRHGTPPGTAQCADALKAYLQRLLDPEILEQIRTDLSQRSFAEVDRYACAHPELAKYTLVQELPRMEYSVVSPAGERLTTAVTIRELFERGGDATAGKALLLWRLANQSLLGDLLVPLRQWMDVELGIAVHARTCRFTLDLRPSHLEVHARAGLSLRTMAAGDEPLELATSEATVRVSMAERCVQQRVDKPMLCKCVVFEEQLEEVAAALAESGALGEDKQHRGGGGGGGGGSGGKPVGEASSLDDVTRELERFMAGDDDEAANGDQNSCRTS